MSVPLATSGRGRPRLSLAVPLQTAPPISISISAEWRGIVHRRGAHPGSDWIGIQEINVHPASTLNRNPSLASRATPTQRNATRTTQLRPRFELHSAQIMSWHVSMSCRVVSCPVLSMLLLSLQHTFHLGNPCSPEQSLCHCHCHYHRRCECRLVSRSVHPFFPFQFPSSPFFFALVL